MACILALPIIYLIGFGSLAIAPVFQIIVAFRFVQMLWLSGIADSAWQAMFNVVLPERARPGARFYQRRTRSRRALLSPAGS